MFKKIYIEITNICNLDCSFCAKTTRKKEMISLENFKILISKLENYTNYLYFHIMGEPTIHPKINELIDLASEKFFVNITTNGTNLKAISNNQNIRQINISLHSIIDDVENNLNNIFKYTEELLNNNTIVNYRIWIKYNNYSQIINKINEYYKVDVESLTNKKIKHNLYIDFPQEFIWPIKSLDIQENGTCKGTIDHIGVLVDGTIVPCCLDNDGIINLGNIYDESLEDIIISKTFQTLKKGFLINKKNHPLCKKCHFYENKKIM